MHHHSIFRHQHLLSIQQQSQLNIYKFISANIVPAIHKRLFPHSFNWLILDINNALIIIHQKHEFYLLHIERIANLFTRTERNCYPSVNSSCAQQMPHPWD